MSPSDGSSEAVLWQTYWQGGKSPEVRNQLVAHYYGLVPHVVARIARRLPAGTDRDVIESAAAEGLTEAVERFDGRRSSDFTGYARLVMRSRVKNALRRMADASVNRRTLKEEVSDEALIAQDLGDEQLQEIVTSMTQKTGASRLDRACRTISVRGTLDIDAYRSLDIRAKAIFHLYFLAKLSQTQIAELLSL